MPLTKQQRIQRARIAALARWSKESAGNTGQAGQAGLLAKFEREAREHEPGLDDAEYARRADCALRAHMERLSFAASRARSLRAEQRRAGGAA
jgi:hypothetical protein